MLYYRLVGDEYINEIPKEIYNTIKNNRDMNYIPQYTENHIMNRESISKEALTLISALNLQYWCKDKKEKDRLNKNILKMIKKRKISIVIKIYL